MSGLTSDGEPSAYTEDAHDPRIQIPQQLATRDHLSQQPEDSHATQEIVSRNWEKAALANQVANLAQESGLETLNLFSRGYISFDDDVASDF